ncbi:hypothetical protein [Castellaniella sp. S9]|uniref:hypothetical protein n=1 Tax=Castellaniella sp. S9 TaxID=2993652 RepID=UPI0022B52EA7|nr:MULTISPECIES: hypothetical protein [Alcaligenaceae]
MNMKALFIAPITALLLGVSGAGVAATSSSDGTTAGMKAESGMMQNGDAARMGDMKPGKMKDHGMMSGDMMSSCPMMGAASGANSKVTMQMHGEMMRAMGDIMIKYAEKLEMPSSPQ